MSADESTEKPNLLRIAEHLERHGVEFMVIGGQAAALLGSPLPTFDVDLCYRRTKTIFSVSRKPSRNSIPHSAEPRETCRFVSMPRALHWALTSLSTRTTARSIF